MYGLVRMRGGWLLFPCKTVLSRETSNDYCSGYVCVEISEPTYATILQKRYITLLAGRTLFNNLEIAQCVQQVLNEAMVDEYDYDLCSINIRSNNKRNEIVVIAVMHSGSYVEGRKWLQDKVQDAIAHDTDVLDILALAPETVITDCKQHGILAISSVA